jgi:hypothetical protein
VKSGTPPETVRVTEVVWTKDPSVPLRRRSTRKARPLRGSGAGAGSTVERLEVCARDVCFGERRRSDTKDAKASASGEFHGLTWCRNGTAAFDQSILPRGRHEEHMLLARVRRPREARARTVISEHARHRSSVSAAPGCPGHPKTGSSACAAKTAKRARARCRAATDDR